MGVGHRCASQAQSSQTAFFYEKNFFPLFRSKPLNWQILCTFSSLSKFSYIMPIVHPWPIPMAMVDTLTDRWRHENTIKMRVLWTEIKCIKSDARLLNRNRFNKGGLDLSKEVLWVSVGQRAAELLTVKVRAGPIGRVFLMTSNFDSP